MNKVVDLNSDLGEGFGSYKMGMDEELLTLINSANVACGFHAGDPEIMDRTVELALNNGVAIGAHPSYPDLLGFGRRQMDISADQARAYVLYQLGALAAFVKAHGGKLSHIKLHGAFYNKAMEDEKLAKAIIRAVLDYDKDLIILLRSASTMAKIAEKMGAKFAQEVFADRAYNDDGSLVSRKLEGSVISDENEALERTLMMVEDEKVISIDGKKIDIPCDSICVHGDNPKAVEFVKKIKTKLLESGVELKSMVDFIKK